MALNPSTCFHLSERAARRGFEDEDLWMLAERAVPMTPEEFANAHASDMRVPATRAAYDAYLREFEAP